MNEAQISLADKISDALKRLIRDKLGSQYKGEAPYSGCRVQEGYFDFLGVECRGSRIRLYLHDFGADSFRADAPEIRRARARGVRGYRPAYRKERGGGVFGRSKSAVFCV